MSVTRSSSRVGKSASCWTWAFAAPRCGPTTTKSSSLPNSQLANARVKNFTKPDATIRVTVNFSVAYGSDVARVKQVVLDAIGALDDILQAPEPQVLFLNMGDFSLDMCARVWVDDYGKQFARKLEMTELVYNTLNERGIEIPFPTRTVYVKQ